MKIIQFYRANGLIVTFLAIRDRFLMTAYSLMLRARFPSSRGLSIAGGSYLRGLDRIEIGRNFRAGKNLRMEAIVEHGGNSYSPRIAIHDDVSVSDNVHIAATSHVELGRGALLGSRVFISDHNHGAYSGDEQSDPSLPPQRRKISGGSRVVIGDDVWIGEGVCILPGVTIGSGSVIGCGSVVTRDIPGGVVAAGNPARVIKKYDQGTRKWQRIR